jgi:hypothetical protein
MYPPSRSPEPETRVKGTTMRDKPTTDDDDDDKQGDWGGRAGEGEPHRTSVQMLPVTEIQQWRADVLPER